MDTVIELLQGISIIIASSVAVWGINSWRRETRWKRKYEISEEVLSLFYECREKIRMIRNPFSNIDEGKSRKQNANESAEEKQILDQAYVFFERYEKVQDTFNKLFSLKFRFMAVFGKESAEPFDEIREVLNSIFMAANRLAVRYWRDQGRRFSSEEKFQKHLREMEKFESIIWEGDGEDDKIASKVNSCIYEIEKHCLTIVKS